MSFPSFEKIKDRKIVQWGAAYLAGAWLVLQAAAILSAAYAWPGVILRALPVVLVVGFLVALVAAWYHGEKRAHRVSGPELVIISVLLVVGGGVVMLVAGGESEPGVASPARVTALGAPAAERSSLAVLPFENMSAADEGYFADGLTEELLNTLAQVPGLRVAARTSAFAFAGGAASADSVGRALGVAHLVEGSVRRAGKRVRISAQLVDARTGFRVWSETYERELADVFAVQDEIARAVAHELRLRVGGESLREAGTDDAEAHALVLRGREIMERKEGPATEWTAAAEAVFEEALARDSAYAAAWAGLAGARQQRAYNDPAAEDQWAAARAAAERALELDEASADAQYVLGIIALLHEADHEATVRHFERAAEFNPSHASAFALLGWVLTAQGRPAEAVRAAERALAIDPLSLGVLNNAGAVFMDVGDLQRAERNFRDGLALLPDDPVIGINLAFVLSFQGEHAEAVRMANEVVAREGEESALAPLAAAVSARAGHHEVARRLLVGVPEDDNYAERAAVAWFGGDKAQSFQLLREGVEQGRLTVSELRLKPDYREMREDPQWASFIEALAGSAGAAGQ